MQGDHAYGFDDAPRRGAPSSDPRRRLWPWLLGAAVLILTAVLVTGTGRAVVPTGSSARVRHPGSTPAPTLPVARCRRIAREVLTGVRTMRRADYRRACGEPPAGVGLDRGAVVPVTGAVGPASPP